MASLLHRPNAEGLEKQAWAAALKGIGQAALKTTTGITMKPIGRLMKSLAKRGKGFKAQYSGDTGKVLSDTVGKEGFMNRMWHLGQKLENGHNKAVKGWQGTMDALNSSGRTGLANTVRYAAPATSAYFIGAPLVDGLLGGDGNGGTSWWAKPGEWVWRFNPVTAGIEGGIHLGTKAYNKVQDIAANKAYEASMRTTYGIAQQLANRNRLEHLYGVWDPEGYANKLMQGAVDGVNKQFAGQMAEMGRSDWRPDTEIGTYGGDHNWNN